MTNTRLHSFRAICVAALCVASSAAAAQDRDVVFQHGIWSSAQTWQQESSNLAGVFKILPRVPTTDSRAIYSAQASDMSSQVGAAAANAILIGHSNGGLVGRLANVPAPYNDRPWGGLVTVGSPHGGAQLMASTVTGSDWQLACRHR
jgi:pimeloyl-ACP methyl ester carboxylesterase